MLAEAGYSLSDHLNGSQFEYELENGDYDFVILQEVGGWPLCASSDFACLEFEPRLRLIANLVRRNGAEPVWMATWHPMADAQGQLSQRVAAISERVGVRTVDTGLSLHSSDEFDALTELLAPDFHPELLGSWYLAALLLATVQENPLSIPTEELSACRHDWREHGLVATEVASGQVTSEPLCDVLSEELAARIVGDVNAALGFLR